jgi:hypothetical protein
MTLTLATGETRSIYFGNWNGRPTHFPLILRWARAALLAERVSPRASVQRVEPVHGYLLNNSG